MFDGLLPEIGDLTALDDAAIVDAAGGLVRAENAACARKLAVMAEIFARRTGLPAEDRELWWVDPQAAVAGGAALQPSRRHGHLRIRPNRPGPNRTERCLELDPNETPVDSKGGHVRTFAAQVV